MWEVFTEVFENIKIDKEFGGSNREEIKNSYKNVVGHNCIVKVKPSIFLSVNMNMMNSLNW